MFGFVINTVSVVIGSIIGLLFRKVIKKEYCESVLKVMGVVIIIVGINGVIENMATVNEGKVVFSNTLLLILSISIGTFIGEFLKIDLHLNNLSQKLETKLNKGNISLGFLTGTLIYCIGAMTIVGSLNDTIGKPEMIYLKSALDGITSIVLASTLGFGVLLSSVMVFIIQGLLTLIFALVGKMIDIESMNQLLLYLGMVGYTIVGAIGINFLTKEKIKVANMIPSLLIPIIYYVVMIWLG